VKSEVSTKATANLTLAEEILVLPTHLSIVGKSFHAQNFPLLKFPVSQEHKVDFPELTDE
jgi:hypothetical protein